MECPAGSQDTCAKKRRKCGFDGVPLWAARDGRECWMKFDIIFKSFEDAKVSTNTDFRAETMISVMQDFTESMCSAGLVELFQYVIC